MKVAYRGYEIEAKRDGAELLYSLIYRLADGFECVASFERSAETEADRIVHLKERVDEELNKLDPWEEHKDEATYKPTLACFTLVEWIDGNKTTNIRSGVTIEQGDLFRC